MLGKVGSLQSIPTPTAGTLNEALKLLSTFGDKKEIAKLLEHVQQVQTLNEQVLHDAQTAIAKLKTDGEALAAEQAKFADRRAREDADFGRRLQNLSQSEARLSGNLSKFDQDQTTAKAKLNEASESLAMAEKAFGQREIALSEAESRLITLRESLNKRQTELDLRAQQLKDRESKLRMALGVE